MDKTKRVLLTIAIAIVFFAFVFFAKQSIYPAPEWEDYCDEFRAKSLREVPAVPTVVENSEDCINEGGKWESGGEDGWCNTNYYCSQDYDEARDIDSKYSFIVFLIISIVTIIISILFIKNMVSGGFLGGGVLLLLYSVMSYWENFSDVLRTVLLGVALVVLVILGYRKFK